MTLKNFIKALKKMPPNARLDWNGQDVKLELQFKSDEGWIVKISPDEKEKSLSR